jgi:nicotinamide phosphoribosyltransferase
MLHDFGFRGATGVEAAELGGMAHLTNFIGTDTLPALLAAIDYYAAEIEDPDNPLGLSVPASEHSVMTILGANGEYDQLANLLEKYPKGILSVVADSYDIYEFVNRTCDEFKDQILERDGRLVIRPDSVTPQHPNPESLVVWIAETLWKSYGGEQNRKSMRVLDDHVRILWGDGLDPKGMERILAALVLHNFSPENIVFGMGGGLLQKVNRDTQRFKIAASAAEFADGWHEDVQKLPLQVDKQSKAGRLALIEGPEGYRTVSEHWVTETGYPNLLKPVFLNGDLVNEQTFDEVRERAGADFRELVAA